MNDFLIYHQLGKDDLYKTWHASSGHLFMYIYSDNCSIVTNDRVFSVKKGALVFIAAGTYHYTMPDNPLSYDRSKFGVSPAALENILKLTNKSDAFKTFSNKAIVYAQIPKEEQHLIDSIFERANESKNSGDYQLIFISGILQLMFFLNKYMIESTTAIEGFMGNAFNYINQNISTDICIDDICAAINSSKYHFCRQFKKHTGLTVMEYILKTRIILAKIELAKTKLSITEISERLGFSSVSYFCRAFKSESGLTPLQYRKKHPTNM